MELASMKAFVEAPGEVTSVEAYMSSISSMEASTDASMKSFVGVASVKASITSTKASITSIKASIEVFLEITYMEAFVQAFVEVVSMEASIAFISSMKASMKAV